MKIRKLTEQEKKEIKHLVLAYVITQFAKDEMGKIIDGCFKEELAKIMDKEKRKIKVNDKERTDGKSAFALKFIKEMKKTENRKPNKREKELAKSILK